MKRISLISFLIPLMNSMFAQHADQYSQYMFNGLVINPAYAGSNKTFDATVLCRNQWLGFEGAPKTASLSLHTPLTNKKLNVGLNITSDNYGITHENIISAVFAYKIQFSKSALSFGLQGGCDINRTNWDLIHTTDGGDNTFVGQSQTTTIPVAGAGLYYRAEKYFAGISSPTLLQFRNDSRNIYKPVLFNAGYVFNTSGAIAIKPSVLLKYLKNSPVELDANIDAYYKNIGLGCSYRTNDALVFMCHYSIHNQFRIGYAYDLTLSKLKTYNKGSHEIMLKYEFGYKVNTVSPRYF